MLRLLILLVLCATSRIYIAAGRDNNFGLNRTGFFDETKASGTPAVTVIREEQRPADNSGKEEMNNLTTGKKTKKLRSPDDTPIATKGTLYLFTTLECNFSAVAVKKVKEFKRCHPEIAVEGRLLCRQADLAKMGGYDELFSEELPLSVDFCSDGSLAREFGIKEVPSYVFVFGAKAYKIAGQPDLEGVYNQCLPL
jgi:hypothetical protein